MGGMGKGVIWREGEECIRTVSVFVFSVFAFFVFRFSVIGKQRVKLLLKKYH